MVLRRSQLWIIGATLALGGGGIVGQVLLWRELLAIYQGNELFTGIVLANWVLAEAVGAYCFSKWPRAPSKTFPVFALLLCLFAICLPVAMVCTRLIRSWVGVALGQPIGPGFVLLSSLCVLAPVSFLHGALFPVAGRLYRDDAAGTSGAAVGALYVWESVGTLLGAVILVFYFLAGGHGFRLVACLWAVTMIVLVWRRGTLCYRSLTWRVITSGVVCILLVALLAGGDRLHTWSQDRQYAPYPVLGSASSPYGLWTILDSDGQYIFVVDGQPTYMTPVPDRVWVEEFAHLPLLLHERPLRVCVIGGGVGGLLYEILRHPVVEVIDYVELDPKLFELFDLFSTDLTDSELGDPRVRIHARDGRQFLQEPGPAYDVIWIGASEPDTLHANRYFTQEFFQALRRRVHADGLIVGSVPGSLMHASVDLQHLQSSVFGSLQRAIGNLRVLPGDGRFLFMASPERDLAGATLDDLMQQLLSRGLAETVGMPWHMEQRLHSGWLGWFDAEYRDVPIRANRDLRPLALFHVLSYYQSVHAPWSAAIMRGLQRYAGIIFAAILLALLLIPWLLPQRRSRNPGVYFQVGSTGFAGMLLDLLVIFAFQSALGSVHVWIGMLMAVFMAGAALAAMVSTRWAQSHGARIGDGLRLSDIAMCGFCSLLPGFLLAAVYMASVTRAGAIVFFLSINFVAGGLTGMLFPLAAAWRGARGDDAGRTAGYLQTSDLVGGWTAGLVGATFMLPLWGVYGTCALLVVIKGLSLFTHKLYCD